MNLLVLLVSIKYSLQYWQEVSFVTFILFFFKFTHMVAVLTMEFSVLWTVLLRLRFLKVMPIFKQVRA